MYFRFIALALVASVALMMTPSARAESKDAASHQPSASAVRSSQPQSDASRARRVQNEPTLKPLYDSLLPRLKTGGVAIYLVPFETIGEDQTTIPNWWRHCPFSKSISTDGMRQAKRFAIALRQIGIPIGVVHSGEYCASLSAATFAVADISQHIVVTPDLNPPAVQRAAGVTINQVIQVRVQAQIQLMPNSGTVGLLSGSRMTSETTPHPVLTELNAGDTAIFELDEVAQPRLLARLNVEQWAEMAAYYAYVADRAPKRSSKTRLTRHARSLARVL
jgi:hypothetical protein